jgi:hypothetical protein
MLRCRIGAYAAHRVDTTALPREVVLDRVRSGLVSGRFRIGPCS